MNWDKYFIRITQAVANKSSDPCSRYGAIIVRPHTRSIISTGYNGIPRNIEYREEIFTRPDKYDYFCHAEENAIFNAGREGIHLEGAQMYVLQPPCVTCTRAIIQSGFIEVVFAEYHPPYDPDQNDGLDNWRTKIALGEEMMKSGGVKMRRMET